MRRGVSVACTVVMLAAVPMSLPVPAEAATAPFPHRGIIEGYYGPPWSHAERLAAFEWMGAHGLNLYVHAPKDDAFQRASWRDPYPAPVAEVLASEVTAARERGVSFVPNVSPGWAVLPARPASGTAPSPPICFSCAADLDLLVGKLAPLLAAGAGGVMVSFDDTWQASPHTQDWLVYGAGPSASGRMHRDLLNRLHARLPGIVLFTVLAEYAGVRDTPYLRAVRGEGGLERGIEVMWTGGGVVSPTITAADARAYAAAVGRDRVVVWDNYPAHDMTGPALGRPPSRVFLGPYAGRGGDLASGASGVVANPMQLPRASRPALATMAAYLADPVGYDPEAAWADALAETGGAGLATLAENSRSSRLDRRESDGFGAVVATLAEGLDDGRWPGALTELDAELDRETRAAESVSDPALAAEVRPWLDTLAANASAARAVAHALVRQRPALSVGVVRNGGVSVVSGVAAAPDPAAAFGAVSRALAACGRIRTLGAVTHGDRFTYVIDALYVGENRVDAFCLEAARRTLRWVPSARRAAAKVRVDVDGAAVTVPAGGGAFEVEVAGAPGVVTATDGAGGRTSVRVG